MSKVLEGLIEPFEDIWARWCNWADARKPKYMRARLRTGGHVGSAVLMGKECDSSELVRLGLGGIKMAGAMPTYLSW